MADEAARTHPCPECKQPAMLLEEFVDQERAINLDIYKCEDPDFILRAWSGKYRAVKRCRLSYFGVDHNGEVVASRKTMLQTQGLHPPDLRECLADIVLEKRSGPLKRVATLRARLRSAEALLREREKPLREIEEAREAVEEARELVALAEKAAAESMAKETPVASATKGSHEQAVTSDEHADTAKCPACGGAALRFTGATLPHDAKAYVCSNPDAKTRKRGEPFRCGYTSFAVLPGGVRVAHNETRQRAREVPRELALKLLAQVVEAKLAKGAAK